MLKLRTSEMEALLFRCMSAFGDPVEDPTDIPGRIEALRENILAHANRILELERQQANRAENLEKAQHLNDELVRDLLLAQAKVKELQQIVTGFEHIP